MPLRRAGTVANTGAWYGPGSAAHRFAKSYALRCVRGTQAPSHHLMHVQLHAVWMPRADADEQVLHQPMVLFTAGFEFRHRAEIDQRGIDDLAARDAVQCFLRPEADADVLDVDDGAVVHLKRVFRFQFGKTVGSDDLEIRAAGKDRAVQARPTHLAT